MEGDKNAPEKSSGMIGRSTDNLTQQVNQTPTTGEVTSQPAPSFHRFMFDLMDYKNAKKEGGDK